MVGGSRHVEASVPDIRHMFLSASDRCAPSFADVRLIAVIVGQLVDHPGFFLFLFFLFIRIASVSGKPIGSGVRFLFLSICIATLYLPLFVLLPSSCILVTLDTLRLIHKTPTSTKRT